MGRTWIIGSAIVLGCFALGSLAGRPSNAQPNAGTTVGPRTEQPAVGRYQLTRLARAAVNESIVVIDTATGHCWTKFPGKDQDWRDEGVPPGAGK